jgi:tRNA(Ile)-lysidine synthase
MSLLLRFQDNWRATNLVAPGGKTLLAVSGGIDSMTMAHLFHEAGLPIAVAHCNFQLRGKEADLDEQLVIDWCRGRDIACHTKRFDTAEKSEEWKKGIQETARILRYEWFERVQEQNGYAAVATAHQADDNVETLLFNLFRGTGIRGLHGIPRQNGNIIRPLLFAHREEIVQYANENSVPFREDASNATDDYQRNAIRRNIVPVIREWFPGATARVNETIARVAEAEIVYDKGLATIKKKLIEQRGRDYYIPILKLRRQEPLHTIIYELLSPFGFTPPQAMGVLSLMYSQTGHFIVSPTHRIIRNRDFLVITANTPAEADLILVDSFPCHISAADGDLDFAVKGKPNDIPRDSRIASIDLAMLEMPLVIRRWRTGDYFYPIGMGMKKKKVSKYLIDMKIPQHEKEKIWIIESNKRIMWIAGHRMDERFKVSAKTENILTVRYTQNNEA